jgi:hypothetical protein
MIPSTKDSEELRSLAETRDRLVAERPALLAARDAAAARLADAKALAEDLDLKVLTGDAKPRELEKALADHAAAERAHTDAARAVDRGERRADHVERALADRLRAERERIAPKLRRLLEERVQALDEKLRDAAAAQKGLEEIAAAIKLELVEENGLAPSLGDVAVLALAQGRLSFQRVLGDGPSTAEIWRELARRHGVAL